jgi:hypothetical protein
MKFAPDILLNVCRNILHNSPKSLFALLAELIIHHEINGLLFSIMVGIAVAYCWYA